MNILEPINIKLDEAKRDLVAFARTLEFQQICEFDLESCGTTIPWKDIVFPGIYFIEIKNDLIHETFPAWVDNFRIEWEHQDYKRHFVSNLRKVRINQHTELNEWIPMYIGKSKQIGGRVHQHIYKELGKPTFALKLNARENMRDKTFRLSVIKVPHENYDWVMPVIEKTLRDKLNPIIGRQ